MLLPGQKKMKISVIVPIYNTGEYLRKCVDSLCRQTHENIEILLINDGSTDNSLEIMEELAGTDERIRIIDKQHEGVSAARNAGLEEIRGDFVSFIDSDDWIDTNMYAVMLSQIAENNVDAAYCEWTEEFSDGTSTVKGYDGRKKLVCRGDEVLACYFENRVSIRLSSGLLRRSMLQEIRFDVMRERGEDMLFCFQSLCRAKGIVYTNTPFYHRFHRAGSLSNRRGFYLADVGRATCTDVMLAYIRKNRPRQIAAAQVYAFNFYMVILNRIVYYRAEREFEETFLMVADRLQTLYNEMKNPRRQLKKELYFAYKTFLGCRPLYYLVMQVYYRYVKRELDSKRQK